MEISITKVVGLVVATLVALVAGFGSWSVVPPGHRGIVIHAGEVQPEVLGEGLTTKWPIYTTIKPMSVRVRQSLIKTTAASKDMQKVHADISVNWHVSPDKVMTVFQQLGDDEDIEHNVIERAVSEVLKASTAMMTAESILTHRIDLKKQIDEELVRRLANFNLVVDVVNLADFDFEPEFNTAVERKQIAEQKAKEAVYVAEEAIQKAKADVERARGQAEAQRLLKQSITNDLIQKLAIEKWNGVLPTVMTGNGGMPFLNLNTSTQPAK